MWQMVYVDKKNPISANILWLQPSNNNHWRLSHYSKIVHKWPHPALFSPICPYPILLLKMVLNIFKSVLWLKEISGETRIELVWNIKRFMNFSFHFITCWSVERFATSSILFVSFRPLINHNNCIHELGYLNL